MLEDGLPAVGGWIAGHFVQEKLRSSTRHVEQEVQASFPFNEAQSGLVVQEWKRQKFREEDGRVQTMYEEEVELDLLRGVLGRAAIINWVLSSLLTAGFCACFCAILPTVLIISASFASNWSLETVNSAAYLSISSGARRRTPSLILLPSSHVAECVNFSSPRISSRIWSSDFLPGLPMPPASFSAGQRNFGPVQSSWIAA